MKFYADLHIHSKYSRATSKKLDLENIYIAAQIKGITVVGTGDAIHPGWFSELSEKLIPAEQGLYKLREKIAQRCDKNVPFSCRAPVRFIIQTEINNIYKKNGKTRRNHNLIFMPDLETAKKLQDRLSPVCNIFSDGRPILGLDAKKLLEIVLEISQKAFLIPAHIWTPWFSILGSKSGFDAIEECFEDMLPHIFALETGLSSDPAMNRMVSDLDDFSLVSNSDAHSPFNLGREVNLFDTTLSYNAIRGALEKRGNTGFMGTMEFYPEEGKYHLDGHRKCHTRFWPKETKAVGKICPVCKKPLTIGVLSRVVALADRKNEKKTRTRQKDNFFRRISLSKVLSETLKYGLQSKKVMVAYNSLISKIGSELAILNDIKIKEIEKSGGYIIAEAINRVRKGNLIILPGYDGKFGKISIFKDSELKNNKNSKALIDMNKKLF